VTSDDDRTAVSDERFVRGLELIVAGVRARRTATG
jgi:hypothetical protein